MKRLKEILVGVGALGALALATGVLGGVAEICEGTGRDDEGNVGVSDCTPWLWYLLFDTLGEGNFSLSLPSGWTENRQAIIEEWLEQGFANTELRLFAEGPGTSSLLISALNANEFREEPFSDTVDAIISEQLSRGGELVSRTKAVVDNFPAEVYSIVGATTIETVVVFFSSDEFWLAECVGDLEEKREVSECRDAVLSLQVG